MVCIQGNSARFGELEDAKFKTNDKNPLTELSGLRFNITQGETGFDLSCQMMFGKMTYEHGHRQYEIGVVRAHLRLTLEGCETALGKLFGETVLVPVAEEDCIESQEFAGIGISSGVNAASGVSAAVNANASTQGTRSRKSSQSKLHLPVTALPNDSWEVKPLSVTGKIQGVIEGTAIPNERLCILQRKLGGNRIAVIGEVQVSKRDIKVSAKGGNKTFKAITEWKNKDVIIGQILKLAVQREAATSISRQTNSTVAISRSEVLEQ